jgi:SAM-dependent methyltransferase
MDKHKQSLPSLKTTDGQRLIWWRETADETYWAEHFSRSIENLHKKAELVRPPLLIRLLKKHLPKHGKIIEAGCGTGWIVATLSQHGYDIEGIDYSESLINKVLDKYRDLPVKVGNVLAIDAPDQYYSAYVSIGVIEHRFDGSEPFLQEAYRVLKRGGIACISVPYFSPIRALKVQMGRYKLQTSSTKPFYQYGFKKPYFEMLANQSGFEVLKAEYLGAGREFREELPGLAGFVFSQRGLWRLYSIMNNEMSTPLLAHMVMLILRKP